MIRKTVAYVFRGTFLETFLKQQYLYENFQSLKVKIKYLAKKFTQGCQRRISRVQSNNLKKKKMIEVNFSVCGFFKSLREFFFTDKKTSPGCQNDNLGVQSNF